MSADLSFSLSLFRLQSAQPISSPGVCALPQSGWARTHTGNITLHGFALAASAKQPHIRCTGHARDMLQHDDSFHDPRLEQGSGDSGAFMLAPLVPLLA